MEILPLKREDLPFSGEERCTFLFAKNCTSVFAENCTFLIAKKCTLLFTDYTSASGSTPVYSFYDKMGRQLRTVSTDYSGDKLYSDAEYDSVGRVSRTSLPYYSSNTPKWTTISYDDKGRVIEKNAADGTKTEFDYDPVKVTTTISKGSKSQTTEKTLNKLGETIQSKDAQNNIVYYDYNPDGTVSSIRTSTTPSDSVKFEYDETGNRISIVDPDAGKVLSSYDGFGRLVREINAKGDTVLFEYDQLGRHLQKLDARGEINYVYINDSLSVAFGKIDSIYLSGGYMSESYVYDNTYGRLISSTNRIPDKTLTNEYSYDWFGRLMTRNYPSGFEVEYSYSDNGYLEEISGNGSSIWTMSDVNEFGQITSYSQGNYSTTVEYDDYGLLEEVTTGLVYNMKYGFDDAGNLLSREDVLTSQKEIFEYDNLNRITGIDYYLNGSHVIAEDFVIGYGEDGNITSKTDVAATINYGEGPAGPHALTSFEFPVATFTDTLPQVITYTCFNKVGTIQDTIGQDTTLTLAFTYGLNNQRVKTVLSRNATVERIKYFNGDYEEDSTASGTKKYHYISAPNGLTAIFVKEGSTDTLFHVLTDHLGSLTGIINKDTDDVSYYSYSAWGVPKNPDDWTAVLNEELFGDRGYTGHEHLTDFNLINMNGRVYDPVLARFLSPDPIVQFPGAVNGYNRYAYVMNNPLIFTDPSGYRPDLIFEEEENYRRQNPGVDFNYFAGYSASGRYDPYHRYRSFHDRFSSAENVGRFSRNPGPIDIYHDQESGESYYIYQSALNGLAYYDKEFDFSYSESYVNDTYIEGYSLNGVPMPIKESGVRYVSDIITFRIYISQAANGGGESSYTGVPDWVDKTNTGIGAFMVGNNTKEQLISYAARTGDIGKTGAKYLKVVKGAGVAGSVFGMGVSGYNIYNDYSQGGIEAVNGWDIADFGAGAAGLGATIFLASNPVGWAISGGVAIYFTVRLIHDVATDD